MPRCETRSLQLEGLWVNMGELQILILDRGYIMSYVPIIKTSCMALVIAILKVHFFSLAVFLWSGRWRNHDIFTFMRAN